MARKSNVQDIAAVVETAGTGRGRTWMRWWRRVRVMGGGGGGEASAVTLSYGTAAAVGHGGVGLGFQSVRAERRGCVREVGSRLERKG